MPLSSFQKNHNSICMFDQVAKKKEKPYIHPFKQDPPDVGTDLKNGQHTHTCIVLNGVITTIEEHLGR